MLREYEEDYHTGMDVAGMAALLHAYTSGYPFLVSRLCKLMDEKIAGSGEFPQKQAAWTKEGFLTAVRMLLTEENTLFESMDNKLIDYPDLKQMLKELLLQGKPIENIPGNQSMRMAVLFGFVTVQNGFLCVANRIFETRLYNGFLSKRVGTAKFHSWHWRERINLSGMGSLMWNCCWGKFGRLDFELPVIRE